MESRDRLRSGLVAWLKVLLPLAALGALSTLFLVSRTIDPEDAIPYATVDVEDRIREPRMTAPTWSGVLADGASLTVTAEEARPDAATGASAARVRADLATPDGRRTRIEAATVAVDPAERRMTLGGGVRIESGADLVIETAGLVADLTRTGLVSTGPVAARGAVGLLEAGRMALTRAPGNPPAYAIRFSDGVRVVYGPPRTEP